MRKWRLIWRVIYDVIRGKAEKLFLTRLLVTNFNWLFTLICITWVINENNPTTRNVYGNGIFDVVDFISLESFIEYL